MLFCGFYVILRVLCYSAGFMLFCGFHVILLFLMLFCIILFMLFHSAFRYFARYSRILSTFIRVIHTISISSTLALKTNAFLLLSKSSGRDFSWICSSSAFIWPQFSFSWFAARSYMGVSDLQNLSSDDLSAMGVPTE